MLTSAAGGVRVRAVAGVCAPAVQGLIRSVDEGGRGDVYVIKNRVSDGFVAVDEAGGGVAALGKGRLIR